MKKLIFILFISLVVFPSCKENAKKNDEVITTYYLIRHAEKDRSDASNKNPELTEQGLRRAENWAKHFEEVQFDAIYSTDYNRTKQTAMPTAKANNLEIQYYNPFKIKIEEFIETTKGETVLVVGHSNTTPQFVNKILEESKYEDIADDNNANLYKVTLSKNGKTSELSKIDIN